MSVFLMGVFDKSCDKWRTVCKCGNGHNDATIQRLQTQLKMVKIGKVRIPSYLSMSNCNRSRTAVALMLINTAGCLTVSNINVFVFFYKVTRDREDIETLSFALSTFQFKCVYSLCVTGFL